MKQPKNLLELQKLVLSNVSNYSFLFQKELIKSVFWLKGDEVENLKTWVKTHFGEQHPEIIQDVFSFHTN